MKKLLYLLLLPLLAAGCSDNTEKGSITPEFKTLVTPVFTVTQSQSAFTGYLEIYPCKNGTSLYYGNYTGTPPKQGPFPGSFYVQSGSIHPGFPTRPLQLPIGTYDLVYWGQITPPDTLITTPFFSSPSLSLNGDLSQQNFGLRLVASRDTLYWPTPDFAYARQNIHIGKEDIGVDLQRAVSGLNIKMTSKGGGALDPSIDTIRVLVGSIAEWLNAYTAAPENQTKTVLVPLKFSPDRMSADNQVTLFPSGSNPPVTIVLQLENGDLKTYDTGLNSRLTVGNMRNLTIEIGEILTSVSTGRDFQVSNWTESDETIGI